MAPAKTVTVNSGFIILGMTVLFVSAVFELIFHAFLYPGQRIFAEKHLIIGLTAAVLAMLLILTLFLYTRQYAKKGQSAELAAVREDWEKTFDTLTDYVSVHDKDFKIVKVNQALCEFLGKSRDEILGKLCYQLFHHLDEPYENCPHKKASEIGHPVTELINDPNIGVPLQITCSPLLNKDGAFQGSVHIARGHEAVDMRKSRTEEIIPICASCKSIRKSGNDWTSPENYFKNRYEISFTHTLCRDCQEKLYPEYLL